MSETLILIKPDGVKRKLIGEIISRFERKGLNLVEMKYIPVVSPRLAKEHYVCHSGKEFFDSLIEFTTSGPIVAMIWEGREAIAVARSLIGATDGTKAVPGTIRGDYATVIQQNLVHGSDSIAAALAEIKIWFNREP